MSGVGDSKIDNEFCDEICIRDDVLSLSLSATGGRSPYLKGESGISVSRSGTVMTAKVGL